MIKDSESDNIFNELQALNGEVLLAIQSHAKKGEMTGLFKSNDWLRQAVNLLNRHESLKTEAQELTGFGRELLKVGASGSYPETGEADPDGSENEGGHNAGGKARGRQCRGAFVQREAQRGKPLTKVRGQLFKTGGGVIVGVGYGKEDENRNHFFIGLQAGQFQEAVLICELLDGLINAFWLPRDFVEKYVKHLSVSKQYNQVKFVVERHGGRFDLRVPAIGPIEITKFMDAKPLTCPITAFD
jgi:hypothetical protein